MEKTESIPLFGGVALFFSAEQRRKETGWLVAVVCETEDDEKGELKIENG